MGTRNSTLVRLEGELKVAQYGQWDGYPTGQGATIQDFLKRVDLQKFKEKIRGVREIDQKVVDDFCKEIGAENGWLNMEQAEKYKAKFPGISRDEGANILNLIYDGKVTEIHLDPDFKEDGLFCEYWYELDLDKETITMNGREFTFDEWRKIDLEKLEKEGRE